MTPFPFALFLAYQRFHQLLRLGKLLQQPIDVFHTRTAAAGDALPSTAIDDGMAVTLVRGHRTDNSFHFPHPRGVTLLL